MGTYREVSDTGHTALDMCRTFILLHFLKHLGFVDNN